MFFRGTIKKPDMSEVDVFQDPTDKLMSFQQQLYATYNTDRQIRDLLLTSIYIPTVREMILYRRTEKAHDLIECVANRQNYTAGSAISTTDH